MLLIFFPGTNKGRREEGNAGLDYDSHSEKGGGKLEEAEEGPLAEHTADHRHPNNYRTHFNPYPRQTRASASSRAFTPSPHAAPHFPPTMLRRSSSALCTMNRLVPEYRINPTSNQPMVDPRGGQNLFNNSRHMPSLDTPNQHLLKLTKKRLVAVAAAAAECPDADAASVQACVADGRPEEGLAVWRAALKTRRRGAGGMSEAFVVAALGACKATRDAGVADTVVATATRTGTLLTQRIVRAQRAVHVAAGDKETAALLLKQLAPLPAKARSTPGSHSDLTRREYTYGERSSWRDVTRDQGTTPTARRPVVERL